jgi:hypothetical protein
VKVVVVQVSEEVLFSQWLPSSPFPLHPIVGVLFSSRWKEKSENCLSDFRSQCLQYFEDCSVFFSILTTTIDQLK